MIIPLVFDETIIPVLKNIPEREWKAALQRIKKTMGSQVILRELLSNPMYNDTDKFFHGISTKSKNTQNTDIRSIITFSRYGIFRFKHYGEHNGKLILYIR